MVEVEVDTETETEVEVDGFSVEVVSEVVGYGEVGYPGLVVDSEVETETD